MTRIMVVGGRGKPEDMEAFDEMQLLYANPATSKDISPASFLLEHGVHASQIIKELNHSNGQIANLNNIKK